MKPKTQRIAAIVIAVLVSFSMIGTAAFGYFYGSFTPSSANPPSTQTLSAGEQFKLHKSQVQALEAQVKANPEDAALQLDLANAYFDLAISAQTTAPEEISTDFGKAIAGYQIVLKTKKDINVLVDMATAAFYAGQDDLAEKSFQEALAEQPKFFNALYNYGVFLAQVKKDNAGAIRLWQQALAAEPSNPRVADLKALIQQAQQAAKPSP